MKLLFLGPSNSYYNQFESHCLKNSYDISCVKDLKKLKEKYSEIALFIIDDDFEEKSSVDFIKTIRSFEDDKKVEHKPIICISDDDTIESRQKAFERGVDDFVDKYEMNSIFLKINSFIRPNTLWQGINAMVVEDEFISAKFISHVIRTKGANVINYNNAVEAFEYLKGPNGHDVDLILTDHMMPNLSGISFVKKIRNELGNNLVPIVFISSVENKSEVLEFYKAGGNDYLSKPLIKEELFVKVDQLLSNRYKSRVLKDQVEQLENVNRVKDKFLAVCTHDLRTPLNTIIGLTNMIIEEESVSQDVGEYLGQIDSSAKNLLTLVNELLDLSEIQSKSNKVELVEVDILSVIKSSLRNFTAINNKKVNMHFYTSVKKAPIYGNQSMLLRVFNNILSNAYKFTPDNGKIYTSVKSEDSFYRIKIEDTGIGMPSDFVSKIFDEFSTIGRTGLKGEKSTGLGMSIVKKIIDDHNGKITVDSIEGKGTIFTIDFKKVKK